MNTGDLLLKQIKSLGDIDVTAGIINGMEIIKEDASNRAPVDTGNLSRSGSVEEKGVNNVELIFNTPYALFVEYGTAKMSAQPYIRPAMEAGKNALMQEVKKSAEEYLAKEVV